MTTIGEATVSFEAAAGLPATMRRPASPMRPPPADPEPRASLQLRAAGAAVVQWPADRRSVWCLRQVRARKSGIRYARTSRLAAVQSGQAGRQVVTGTARPSAIREGVPFRQTGGGDSPGRRAQQAFMQGVHGRHDWRSELGCCAVHLIRFASCTMSIASQRGDITHRANPSTSDPYRLMADAARWNGLSRAGMSATAIGRSITMGPAPPERRPRRSHRTVRPPVSSLRDKVKVDFASGPTTGRWSMG